MQNRYVADVGDFAKFGLLRFLSGVTDPNAGEHLQVGILWYMHHDEQHNTHGRHITYLKPTEQNRRDYGDLDVELWHTLAHVLSQGDRCVHCTEEAGLLPEGTQYYGALLRYSPDMRPPLRRSIRQSWFETGLSITQDANLICVDPDNGIGRENQKYRQNGPKFTYMSDLEAIWERGQSLVIYQQMVMDKKGPQMVREKSSLLEDALGVRPIPLWFSKGTARVFFVVPQPEHQELIGERVDRFVCRWGQHFRRV